MKQRLAIARATVHEPTLLLFDEPFTGLDEAARQMLSSRINAYRDDGRTLLLVTHDLSRAFSLTDEFILLARGRIVGQGDTSRITLSDLERLYAETVGAIPE